jgi:hypothetical protein
LGAYPRRSIFTLLNFKAENKGIYIILMKLLYHGHWKICGKRASKRAGRQI